MREILEAQYIASSWVNGGNTGAQTFQGQMRVIISPRFNCQNAKGWYEEQCCFGILGDVAIQGQHVVQISAVTKQMLEIEVVSLKEPKQNEGDLTRWNEGDLTSLAHPHEKYKYTLYETLEASPQR